MMDRFTPTCVGTTLHPYTRKSAAPVHPHVRGDNRGASRSTNRGTGSPPRAWGQRSPSPSATRAIRFTPTCVGTTTPGDVSNTMKTVHPHVRGDNRLKRSEILRPEGSPPRAWGQRVRTWQTDQRYGSPPRAWGQLPCRPPLSRSNRFTPTCVGTTPPSRM